ncbi:sugar phosphate isomerase/epimerase family protein [Actinoalloteichus sp. GBA129-24]|uniref:sugar phosphate isomerase/epimerase family protein n=1 Tax=Actinoalloteichus sp. GBA129-24 TaxID=1612551 RepID=UPI0009503919|nr:sugar phosphate isomerase/epimerase family protein [Actinoalloteichus sp. GBA129-24]APU22086.1 sugar phosphate isomerase/epimerase [Actinoalloteichus sp. GBA129-24]
MTIGLSTYAFFWRLSDRMPRPLSLTEALAETRALGVSLFQICDHPELERMSTAELRELRTAADGLGLTLELGTRGLHPDHLRRYLEIARILGVRLLRSMMNSGEDRPSLETAEDRLRTVLPEFAAQGVTLALETYEQVPTATLLRLIERIDSPNLGVCLDPANVVAALEHPVSVVETTASRVVNVHVKDFAFSRQDGWVGFTLAGAPLGTGLLDYDHLIRTVDPEARGVNQVIEHWLPWQGDPATTRLLEEQWTRHNIEFLKERTS